MTTRSVIGALLLTAVAAACSGSDDAADETTAPIALTAPSTTSAVSTSAAPTTTVVPVTTVQATVAPTTTPATTIPPTGPPTPIDPDVALAQAVERDWKTAIQLRNEAIMYPNDSTRREAAMAYAVDNYVAFLAEYIDKYPRQNRRILPAASVTPTLTVEEGPVPVVDTTDEVEITVCEINPWTVVEVGDDGIDRVVDDKAYALRYVVRLRIVDDIWRTSAQYDGEVWEDATTCPA